MAKTHSRHGNSDFDDAMHRLVRVSPKELDAEEAKYKAMRKRLRDQKAKRRRKGERGPKCKKCGTPLTEADMKR